MDPYLSVALDPTSPINQPKPMPHDINNRLLFVGAKVIVSAVIKDLQPNPDYCNCTLELAPMPPNTEPFLLTLNCAQVEMLPTAPPLAERTLSPKPPEPPTSIAPVGPEPEPSPAPKPAPEAPPAPDYPPLAVWLKQGFEPSEWPGHRVAARAASKVPNPDSAPGGTLA